MLLVTVSHLVQTNVRPRKDRDRFLCGGHVATLRHYWPSRGFQMISFSRSTILDLSLLFH
ncbi:hypothetical protein RSAG8_08889, partial [Rhizoctonia solani AG-8 WAC10335]